VASVMYVHSTQIVSEMSLSGVRFEVSIAAINSCGTKFQYLCTTRHSQIPEIVSSLSSFLYLIL